VERAFFVAIAGAFGLGIAAALENCSLLAAGVAVAVGVVLRKPGFDKRIVWLVGGSRFRAFDPQSERSLRRARNT
jgi:hypothetical protein